mmetsp:Transcript_136/g.303  ORF Transcript_136/g.303 Transcript_136/m.303 type:complete len:483 (+) Transcript_136:66-1514(+)
MSWVLIAVATVAVLLPFASSWTLPSTHRFLASPSLSRPHLRRPCPGVVPLRSTAESSPAAGVSTDDDGAPWWKSFTLEHAWVAEQTRPQFPILSRTVGDDKPLIYLDSAATSQKPSEVVDALRRYYDTMNSNVHRGAHFLSQAATTAYEDSRDAVAELIGAARREEVVFTSGATQGLNLLARSLGDGFLVPEDGAGPSEVVVTAMEHHSNIVPWQMLAERLGPERLVVKYAGLNADRTGLDADHLRSLVTPRTKVVSFVHVSNALGCINPVDEIVSHVRSNAHPDCAIVLDACQSVPHMAVDVGALGVDFLVGSAHKFCGPTGIGFLWGKYTRLEALPPYQGGGEMIDTVTLGGSTYAPPPARFEAGTPPIAQAVGMGAAARYVQRVGMENIHAYEKELGQYLVRRMNEVPGVTAFGPPPGEPRAALVSFATEGVHASDLSTFLDMEGVAVRAGHHCCQPLHTELGVSHSARASLYFYNTKR